VGEDLTVTRRTGGEEVSIAAFGASSTMPQKTNRVAPSVLGALARHGAALDAAMQGAMLHRDQRDGAAWMVEWMSLPQICMGLAKGLDVASALAKGLTPQPAVMTAAIEATGGLLHAEALSFALAAHMPRPEAQEAVKTLCATARDGGGSLAELAQKSWPDLDLSAVFDAASATGDAPEQAKTFAAATAGL